MRGRSQIKRFGRVGASLVAGAVATALATSVGAQVWNGGSPTTNNWDDPDNWVPNGVPANNGSAAITMAGTNRVNPVVNTPWSINGLTFDSTAVSTFNLGGSTLTVGAGGVTNNSGVLQVIDAPVTLSGNQPWSVTPAGSATQLNGTFTTPASTTFTKTGSGTLRISGPQARVFNNNLQVAEGNLVLDTDAGTPNASTGRRVNLSVSSGATITSHSKTQNLRTLTIDSGANVGVFGNGNRLLAMGTGTLIPDPLTINGTGRLDLVDNKMAVRNGTLGVNTKGLTINN